MARYTELFSEWLENGGELPAVFSQIEGFSDLFIAKYADREIGFETPVLFQLKLNGLADLKLPAYAARIARISELEGIALTGNHKNVRTGGITRNYGDREDSSSDLPSVPYNAGASEDTFTPTAINRAKAYEDGETYDSITDTETGLTATEANARLTALEDGTIKILIEDCLNEFTPLFMEIF